MARRDSHRSQPGEESTPEHPTEGTLRRSAAKHASSRESGGESDFQTILELAPDAIIVSSANGHIILVNRQAERLFGHNRANLLGQPVTILIPEGLRSGNVLHPASHVPAPHMRSIESGLQLIGRRQDGSEFPVEVRLSPRTKDGADDQPLLIATVHDISELKRTQAALAALEAASLEQRQLLALTDTALSSLALDNLLGELLGRLQEATNADNVAILLLDESEQELHLRAARGLEEEVVGKARVPIGKGFAGRIVASREPLIVDDLSTFPVVNPILRERLRSAVGVPLLAGDHLIGVLHIGSITPYCFSNQDLHMLELVGERIALAIDRAQLHATALAARAEAERERARWQAAMDSVPAFVITCDPDLRLTYINPAYERLLGSHADLAKGLEVFGLLADSSVPIAPDQTPLARAVREQRGIPGVEIHYHASSGEERLILWDTAPIIAEDGSPLGAVSVGWDITEQRQLERSARDHTAQLEAIIEAITDSLLVYDTDGRIIMSNAAAREMLVRFIPDAPGETLRERNAQTLPTNEFGEPLSEAQWAQTRALQGEIISGADPVEMVVRSPDGEEASFTVTASPLRDAAGNIVGAVTVSRDVTTHRRLEREHDEARVRELAALELNRRLDEFLSIAAHDIRNPVTTVYTSVQTLQRRVRRLQTEVAGGKIENQTTAMEALGRSVTSARNGVERLIRLIERLFDITQAHAGKLGLQLALCDLATIAREQVAAQRAAQPERTIHLELPDDQPVTVTADADRLGEVLANYLSNALKYSAKDHPVTVRLEIVAERAVMAVRDAGPGLPPVEQLLVWEMFHSAPGVAALSVTEGQGNSLGLGLHICKRLIEAHAGGEVGVQSEVGVGSTFWFSLPLADAPSPADG